METIWDVKALLNSIEFDVTFSGASAEAIEEYGKRKFEIQDALIAQTGVTTPEKLNELDLDTNINDIVSQIAQDLSSWWDSLKR